jgi:FkbM family methyltransferase
MIAGILSKLFRKIRLVAASDLAAASKLRYLRDVAIGFLDDSAARKGYREYRLRGGASVILRGVLRENSTDEKVFEEVFMEKVYAPYVEAARQIAPIILVDLGANIGLSVIALARKLRPRAIVAVEPDRGNFSLLQENLRRAGFMDSCMAVQAFAGAERGFAELVDSGNGAWGMRMGAPARTGIPVLPVEDIIHLANDNMADDKMASDKTATNVAVASPETKIVLKCDIEGAELHLFLNLRQWEDRVHYIILELHTEFLSVDHFRQCLEASRYHWRMDGEIPPHAVLAVIGLERLAARTVVHSEYAAGS